MGQIEHKAKEDQGYKSELAAAITAASATIGPIFPPSIPLIIYGTAAEVSGVRLLIACVIPGLLITFLLMLQIGYFARKYNFPAESRAYNVKEVFNAFRKALPALLAPVILVGGLLSGFFSPTEVAAVTVFYGLILGKFIYKELTWQQLIEVGRQSIRQTTNIMFIISSAAIFAFALTVEQVHVQMADMLLGISKNPVILLLIVNLLLLVVGMIMETIAAILVLTPLLVPALSQAGVDPIHLGIVMVLNLMIGLLTPPVGMSLYMVSIVSEVPVEKVIRAILPYFLPLILSLIIVTLFPMISTWLPGLLF
jgi:tripartite ATP-independent transporter DctM subunit